MVSKCYFNLVKGLSLFKTTNFFNSFTRLLSLFPSKTYSFSNSFCYTITYYDRLQTRCVYNYYGAVISNVFRTGPVIEPEKLPIHGSLVGSMVKPWSNRWRHKYIIYKWLKFKIIIKIKIIIYILFKN